MGYNTTVNILNDGLDQLKRNPEEFVTGILNNIWGGKVSVGNHAGIATVMPTGHANDFRLYSVQGNFIAELSRYNTDTMASAMRIPNLFLERIAAARRELDELEKFIAVNTAVNT